MTKTEQAIETLKMSILAETGTIGVELDEIRVVTMFQLAHYGIIKIDNSVPKHTREDIENMILALEQVRDETQKA